MTVKEILAYNVEENISYRLDLEDLAFSALRYEMEKSFKVIPPPLNLNLNLTFTLVY